MRIAILSLALLLPLAADAAPAAGKAAAPTATAVLVAKSGSGVSGTIEFIQRKNAVVIAADIAGLPPGSANGLQLHEQGDCTAADASSAGAPLAAVNKTNSPGNTAQQPGSVGSISANKKGRATAKLKETDVTLDSLIGKSVIVYRAASTATDKSAGTSGARIACGVIKKSTPEKAASHETAGNKKAKS